MNCVRCGQCCISVGRTFWRHGNFKKFPELLLLAENTESLDDGLPCGMLQMTDGVASCRIELQFGKKAKPKVCREYPVLSCLQVNPLISKGRSACYLETCGQFHV